MSNLKKTDWGINVVGPQGINAENDIGFGIDDQDKAAFKLGKQVINEENVGLWESGKGQDSIQQSNTLCEATGECAVATGVNTHAGATGSLTEGALTTTRNDYNEKTETGFDAAYSHAEGFNNATNNMAEHGQGKFGWSYYADNHDPSKCSIDYIGIGTNNQDIYRKDAEVTMVNGDKYIIGIGGYDGKDIENAKTIQQVISEIIELISNK